MPEFLAPGAARFELRDGTPVIHLDVEAPEGTADGPWGLLSRATLCVVDGPGDAGYLLPRMAAGGDPAPEGWDDAVDRAGGCHVAFTRSADLPPVFAGTLD